MEYQQDDLLPNVLEPSDHILISWGLGADSSYVLVRIMDNPTAYGVRSDYSNCTVVHAVTGDEWPNSVALANQHIVPMLRARRIRLVQLARAGLLRAASFTVLSDTTEPTEVYQSGDWSLSKELEMAGTLPRRAGPGHPCSNKFKGTIIDDWAKSAVPYGYRHMIGYDADEGSRAKKDSRFTTNGRRPWYPLREWGLGREQITAGLRERFGLEWPKSYCVECPFPSISGSQAAHLERALQYPEAASRAAVLEYAARSLNEGFTLYRGTTLPQLFEATGNWAAIHHTKARLAALPWRMVEVRRVITAARSADCRWLHGDTCSKADCRDPQAKGVAWRSVKGVSPELSRSQATRELIRAARARGVELESADGIRRLWSKRRAATYPQAEAFLTVVPATVKDKSRPGFETVWESATSVLEAGLLAAAPAYPGNRTALEVLRSRAARQSVDRQAGQWITPT